MVSSRKEFKYEKPLDLNISDIVILDNDTLYDNSYRTFDLDFLKKKSYEYPRMLRYYERIVFCYTTSNPPIKYQLYQWNSPIVIFLDPKLPKDVINKFKVFFSSERLKSIINLNISFSKKLKNANYYIKTIDEDINGYDENYEFESVEERENSILTGITYNLVTDGNNKFHGCLLQINPEKMNTKTDLLKKLKQVFFKSLGNFIADNYKDKNSLLHKKYDNSDKISQFDLDILKIHYSVIYDQKIYGSTFKKLINLTN